MPAEESTYRRVLRPAPCSSCDTQTADVCRGCDKPICRECQRWHGDVHALEDMYLLD